MNRVWKVLLPLVLVVALMTAAMPVFAAESPTTKAIGSVKIASSTYTGKKLTPKITVYDKAGKKINSKYYTVTIYGGHIRAVKHKVVITAKAPYTGKKTAYWTINKAKNPFTIKVGKTSFTQNTKKNQTTSIKVSGVKGGAKLGKWMSSTSKVYVKGGKVIIKKGFYGSATISVATLGTNNYKYTKKSIKITVKKK